MKSNRGLVPLILLLTFSSSWAVASDSRRDGNWWRSQEEAVKANYVTGFFDGMELGHNFSHWKFTPSKGGVDKCFSRVVESYYEFSQKYFAKVTNGQLRDGLNSFYADYRNRSILVHNAIWLVVNGIAGKSEEEMEKMTEVWRKNAGH